MRSRVRYAFTLLLALVTFNLAGLGAAFTPVRESGVTPLFAPEITGSLATLGSNGSLNPNVVVLGYSESVRIFGATTGSIVTKLTVTTPAAVTFTCVAATDVCTSSAATLLNGLKGQASTTTTLPAGLSASTDYFVIYVSSTTFKLATSYANAIAGTAINITDTGTGTHTFTPTTLAGGTASLQGSINRTDWVDIASPASQNVTATSNLIFHVTSITYPWVRVKFVNTAGVFTSTTQYAFK